ncbi:hypothetical protein [Streptomyces sp. 3N207]|uniref:hypothetical protein n=1 Tax=Streptomyces sp. 3N207 TaxID=3457417 RepID=UPI003FD16C09
MWVRRVQLIGAGVALVMLLAGGWFKLGERPGEEGRSKLGDGSTRITLDDGRRVSLRYGEKGLVERHQKAKGGSWSEPRLLYRTKENDCQSVTLATHRGTVAAIADYGYGCPAGSPPDYSIAAVATADDLGDWDVEVTEHFDGWEHVRFSFTGNHVRFEYPTLEGTATLDWWPLWGFTDPDL